MERPGLEALLAYARKGDTLSVVRLDRLGRSLSELLATVAMLKERGIALLSLEEQIDTKSAGRFCRAVEEDPSQPLYITEICKTIRVSDTTLEVCCQEQLGIGPKRYLLLR